MNNSDLFYQSVTAEFFYVCERQSISIVETRIISAIKCYYVRWSFGGSGHAMYLSSANMKSIADAMESFYGSISESTQAWNALYLKCLHDENCVLITDNHENK